MSYRWSLPLMVLLLWATGCRPESFLSSGLPRPTPAAQSTAQSYPVYPLTLEANLDQLESYRTHLTLDFDGQRGETPSQGHIERQTAIDRTAGITHYLLETGGSLSDPQERSELLRVGDKVYLKREQEQLWFALPPGDSQSSPGALGLWEPERWAVLPATVRTPPQFERLDGQETQRYRFTEADLAGAPLLFEGAEGEFWVSVNGRYLLRYTISATVRLVTPLPNATFFDEGHFQLDYSLTDINAELDLLPPEIGETIPPPLLALPRLPDAEVTTVFPALLEYTSAISPVSATLFYQDALLNQGWTEETIDVFNEKANLTFSKEDQSLQVIIYPDQLSEGIKVTMDLQSRSSR